LVEPILNEPNLDAICTARQADDVNFVYRLERNLELVQHKIWIVGEMTLTAIQKLCRHTVEHADCIEIRFIQYWLNQIENGEPNSNEAKYVMDHYSNLSESEALSNELEEMSLNEAVGGLDKRLSRLSLKGTG
jgi:hypothetical protein